MFRGPSAFGVPIRPQIDRPWPDPQDQHSSYSPSNDYADVNSLIDMSKEFLAYTEKDLVWVLDENSLSNIMALFGYRKAFSSSGKDTVVACYTDINHVSNPIVLETYSKKLYLEIFPAQRGTRRFIEMEGLQVGQAEEISKTGESGYSEVLKPTELFGDLNNLRDNRMSFVYLETVKQMERLDRTAKDIYT